MQELLTEVAEDLERRGAREEGRRARRRRRGRLDASGTGGGSVSSPATCSTTRSSSRREGAPVMVRVWREAGRPASRVEDLGPGHSARPSATRSSSASTRWTGRARSSGPGSGLGLAIVKHIAQLHGATVDVEGEVGPGQRRSSCGSPPPRREERAKPACKAGVKRCDSDGAAVRAAACSTSCRATTSTSSASRSWRVRIHEAAQILDRFFEGEASVAAVADQIKRLEHECDEISHEILRGIDRTFITPIDREDIHQLAVRLDDVIDLIDGTVRRVSLFLIDEPDAPLDVALADRRVDHGRARRGGFRSCGSRRASWRTASGSSSSRTRATSCTTRRSRPSSADRPPRDRGHQVEGRLRQHGALHRLVRRASRTCSRASCSSTR